MGSNHQPFLGQHIKIKSAHPPYSLFNRELGTVVGFDDTDHTVLVRPDSDPGKILKLYPREIRDTDPPQEVPPAIRRLIPELA